MTKHNRALDKRIASLYSHRCSGVQINIRDIGKVYAVARQAAATGGDDQQVGDAIAAYVQTIRQN